MNRQAGKKSIWQGLILMMTSLFAGYTPAAGLLTPGDGSLPALEIREHPVDVLIVDGYRRAVVARRLVRGAAQVAPASGLVGRHRRCRCLAVVV